MSVADDIPSPPEVEERQNSEEAWRDHYRISNSTEQNVASALAVLERLGQRLDIVPDVRERAAELYAEAAIETSTDGRSTESVVAACLVMAGRELQAPIPTGRVADAADLEQGQLRRAASALRSELGCMSPPCPPEAYLADLTRALALDNSTRTTAGQILEAVPSERVGGKHPGVVAGAALYLAADGAITQREVADVTGVTTETVRLRVKECRHAWLAHREPDRQSPHAEDTR